MQNKIAIKHKLEMSFITVQCTVEVGFRNHRVVFELWKVLQSKRNIAHLLCTDLPIEANIIFD